MSSAIESQRSAAEELERIEQAIADRIIFNPKLLPDTETLSSGSVLNGKKKRSLRDTVVEQHEIAKFLDRYQEQCQYLRNALESDPKTVPDEEKALHPSVLRQKEYNALSSLKGSATAQIFEKFYKEIDNIQNFYKKYPNDQADNLARSYKMRRVILQENQEITGQTLGETSSLSATEKLLCAYSADLNIDNIFVGEEYFGRFVDLLPFHESFLNIKSINSLVSYTEYLDVFYKFDFEEVYNGRRYNDNAYEKYISSLDGYLTRFWIKTRILAHPESNLKSISQEFENQYENNRISWISKLTDKQEEKNELFCKACGKLFATEGVYKGHLNGKQHKKNSAALRENDETKVAPSTNDKFKMIVFHEFRVKELARLLEKTITDTKSNIERRQTLTESERQLETATLENEIFGDEELDDNDVRQENSDDESDNETIYNPLKLPIGWDGKPIPFWLWKLQGMGIEYVCEICGNYSYMGRKEFERHFMEPRHIHGLKCLGIEPGPLFKGITAINDAEQLWNKAKKDHRKEDFRYEHAIEMEDSEGNVMSEKVYNDLKKQGLI